MTDCTLIDKLRQPKIADMSIFDWLTSMVAAVLIGVAIGIKNPMSWIMFSSGWVLFGIIMHWIFGVPTMLGYYLGINNKPVRKNCGN